ncbi:MAG: PepSY domain-containing protein, partial [Bacillota bacterium]
MKSTMIKVIGSLVGGLTVFFLSAYVFQFAMGTAEAKMSIEEIEALASDRFPGEVVEVEYDDNTYEIEIKTETQSFELVLDATSGEILYLEEKNQVVATSDDVKVNDDGTSEETTTDDTNEASTNNKNQTDEATDTTEADTTNDDTNEAASDAEEKSTTPSTTDDEGSKSIPNDKASDVAKDTVANTPAVMINQGQAQKIAREKADNAKVTEIELEEDDGATYYQVELENDTHEFEVEIDAFTGKVLIIEMEQRDDQASTESKVMSREAILQLINKSYANYRIEKIELD